MDPYTADDVAGLEAKLAGLPLNDGEQAVLRELVAQAEEAVSDVTGFAANPDVKGFGSLGFMVDISPKPGDALSAEFLSSGHSTGIDIASGDLGSGR